jgi:hypothetical protein
MQGPILAAFFNLTPKDDAGPLEGRGINQRDRFTTIEAANFQTFRNPRIITEIIASPDNAQSLRLIRISVIIRGFRNV